MAGGNDFINARDFPHECALHAAVEHLAIIYKGQVALGLGEFAKPIYKQKLTAFLKRVLEFPLSLQRCYIETKILLRLFMFYHSSSSSSNLYDSPLSAEILATACKARSAFLNLQNLVSNLKTAPQGELVDHAQLLLADVLWKNVWDFLCEQPPGQPQQKLSAVAAAVAHHAFASAFESAAGIVLRASTAEAPPDSLVSAAAAATVTPAAPVPAARRATSAGFGGMSRGFLNSPKPAAARAPATAPPTAAKPAETATAFGGFAKGFLNSPAKKGSDQGPSGGAASI